jgi:putative ABC transport system permease protein
MTNIRVILRGLVRAPIFSGVAILSLALGIGANTAIFSLLDQIVLRQLPVKNPGELVFLSDPGPAQGSYSSDDSGGPSFSYPMLRELQKAQTPFTALVGARTASASLSYKNHPLDGDAHFVSGNYFDVLGVSPSMGRLLTEDDDRTPGGHPVAVLSYSCWISRFGGDIGMLNQSLIVNGYPMTIVGVAAKGFNGEKLGSAPDVFVPITMKKELTPDWDGLRNRKVYWVTMFGRLKSGVTMAQAETAINIAYHPQIEQDALLLGRPSQNLLSRFRAKRILLKPGAYGRRGLRDEGKAPLLLLMGMSGMVLLIACANVANLQLARAAGRSREIAVRLAIGGSRLQLVRQLLMESCALALAGGVLGLGFAYWMVRAVIAIAPVSSGMGSILTASLDLPVLLFCLGLSIFTGLLFGVFPALQSTRPDLAPSLKGQSGQSTASGSAKLFRETLVVGQVAISLLLLVSAGLFARTLVNLSKIDLGLRVARHRAFPRLQAVTTAGISPWKGTPLWRRTPTIATMPALAPIIFGPWGCPWCPAASLPPQTALTLPRLQWLMKPLCGTSCPARMRLGTALGPAGATKPASISKSSAWSRTPSMAT